MRAIEVGVPVMVERNPQPLPPRTSPNAHDLTLAMEDAVEKGAAAPLPLEAVARTKTWTPTFLVPKRDSPSMRVITDLRALNRVAPATPFHPDGWKDLLLLLRDPDLRWGASVDMQDWFHNLAVHREARRWMRVRVGDRAWELRELPFGLNSAPWWSHRLALPVIRHLRSLGIPFIWYVDDILVLGTTKEEVTDHLVCLLNLLTRLGLRVNAAKSCLTPSQQVPYLGHLLDLAEGRISPLAPKVQSALGLWRRTHGPTLRPVDLAALAGSLLDLAKSNVALMGLPRCLMKAAGTMVNHAARSFKLQHPGWSARRVRGASWHQAQEQLPQVVDLLQEARHALMHPAPVVIPRLEKGTSPLQITSDASEVGWGGWLGSDPSHPLKVVSGIWTPHQRGAHSTALELWASARVVEILLGDLPPSTRHIIVRSDCSSVVWGWNKGSARPHMNEPLRRVRRVLAMRGISVEGVHVAGLANGLADVLSRQPDQESYGLRIEIFNDLLAAFRFQPQVDLFAHPGNAKLPLFYSKEPHESSAGVNSLLQPWGHLRGWMNPPWHLVPAALRKLQEEQATVLALLPMWRAKPWFGAARALAISPVMELDGPLFVGPTGLHLPRPPWLHWAAILSGRKDQPLVHLPLIPPRRTYSS